MIRWLNERNMHINFNNYQGKSREDLLMIVRRYHEKFSDDAERANHLRRIMESKDWDEMVKLAVPEVESTMPPKSSLGRRARGGRKSRSHAGST